MASVSSQYVAVTNIPFTFHSADLRSHFSSFVESKSFACFHFRHRPEKSASANHNHHNNNAVHNGTSESEDDHSPLALTSRFRSTTSFTASKLRDTRKRCCIVKLRNKNVADLFVRQYHHQNWTDRQGGYFRETCEISFVHLKNEKSENSPDSIEEKVLLSMQELNPPVLMPNGNVGTPTLVFLDFVQQCLLPQTLIEKLQLEFPKTRVKRLYAGVEFDYGTDNEDQIPNRGDTHTFDNVCNEISMKLSKCPEDKQGVSSLCVPKEAECSSANRCSDDLKPTHSINSIQNSGSSFTKDLTRSDKLECDAGIFKKPVKLTNRERKRKAKEERKHTFCLMNEGIEERLIQAERSYYDENDAEEWDRHEASEDDPSNQERNKERLYEEEIEQPWEKGGPGVVFYTDAMYWQKKEGDFDEQTTDDLDVDFSPYEGHGPGDKDIQDFLKIRQETRYRNGYDSTDMYSIGIARKPALEGTCSSLSSSSFSSSSLSLPSSSTSSSKESKIGNFESHTRGFGRKILEKQGWKDGDGLGSSKQGISQALKGEGQKPQNKKGLGFVPEKPTVYGFSGQKKARLGHQYQISTAFDDPRNTDPKEELLQRRKPTALKHRASFVESFINKTV